MADKETLGWSQLDAGDIESARETATSMLGADSNSVAGLCLMAAIQAETDDLEAAIASLEQAMAVDPEDVRPHIQSAEIHLYSERPEAALQSALCAIDTAGDEADFVDAVLLKAAAESALEQDDEARRSLSEIDPSTLDEPPLLLRSGDLWLHLEEWEPARAAFALCVEIEPELADAHYGLGCALTELGDDEAATGAWLRSLELDATAPRNDDDEGLLPALQKALAPAAHAVRERPTRDQVKSGLDPRAPYDVTDEGLVVFGANLAWVTDLEGIEELATEIKEDLAD